MLGYQCLQEYPYSSSTTYLSPDQDFRSPGGLYDQLREKYALETSKAGLPKGLKGADFFDYNFFNQPNTRPFFNKFIAELKGLCESAKPTATHYFIKSLWDKGRIIRWYTQNIDCLESQVGLRTTSDDLIEQSPHANESLCNSNISKGEKRPAVVTLHGSISYLACVVCKKRALFDCKVIDVFQTGIAPECLECKAKAAARSDSGRRQTTVGIMRPDIVLYHEVHPHGDQIGRYVSEDLRKNPAILLVIGTSLKVIGLKKIVKDFAKSARLNSTKPLVLYINKTPLQSKEWTSVFDYQLIGAADEWSKVLLDAPCSRKAKPEEPAVANKSKPHVRGDIHDIRTFIAMRKHPRGLNTYNGIKQAV